MKRLKVLIWHIHGSYLNTLTHLQHDWYLPVNSERSEGYLGRGETFDYPDWAHEVPADEVRNLDLDLIIFQTPKNLLEDQFQILSEHQRGLPRIYLEHNTPRPHPVDTKHAINDPRTLLVHVTHYNRLMWDNGETPTVVIEHSVAIDPTIEYQGNLGRGIVVINGMQRRPRIAGYDIFQQARTQIPLDVAGMETEQFGGLGDIPYRDLHARIAPYRFLFSPIRYTSLPLAVIEAMSIGMPVVALATTELPTVLKNGHNGFISCDVSELLARMQFLLDEPGEAKRLGMNARSTALSRFGLDRFAQGWDGAFGRALRLRAGSSDDPPPDSRSLSTSTKSEAVTDA